MVDWNLVSNDVVNWSAIQTISNAILASGLIVITAYYAYQTNKQVKLMKETREYELMKEKRQFRSDNLQRQLHIYSKLMGLIFTTTQIYDFDMKMIHINLSSSRFRHRISGPFERSDH
jgi:heme/copper-type cytochrome/quinol oxidase subunit 3